LRVSKWEFGGKNGDLGVKAGDFEVKMAALGLKARVGLKNEETEIDSGDTGVENQD